MKLKLKKARLSFPHLFTAQAYEEGKDPTFNGNFLLDAKKDVAQIKMVREAIDKLAKEHWKGKIPKLKGICLKKAEPNTEGEYETDGYDENTMYVSASSKKRIPIVDLDPNVALAETDGKIYAGCYVNVSFKLWVQDNKYGQRVNAQLLAVQFAGDGQPFGEKPVDPSEEFDKIEEDDASVENESLM